MTISIANAPCSWGTLEGHGARIPYERMLDELVETGYVGTELGDYGFMPTEPGPLGRALRRRGLTLLGAFQGVDLRRREAVREARPRLEALASLLSGVADDDRPPYLILADDNGRDAERWRLAGRIGPEDRLPADEWRTFVHNAEEVARIARGETGIATLFHPHCAGFVETPEEAERLMEDTDPDLLGMVFDTGHYLYGTGRDDEDGREALRGLERFWERVPYVHVKDCEPDIARRARREEWDYTEAVRQGVFCELGDGSIDFAAIVAFLRERDYDDWITVEQDVLPGMGTPRESAQRNREHLQAIGL